MVEPINAPLGITYKDLLEMIYSIVNIGKEHFQLILSCKYPMKRGNKFQPCPVKNDNDVAWMLEMYNRFEMDEVELFVEQISLHLHVNSPIDNLSPLLPGGNDDNCNVPNSLTIDHGEGYDEREEDERQCSDNSVRVENRHEEGCSSFVVVGETIEREQIRYVAFDEQGCNLSNNSNTEDSNDPIETPQLQFHLPSSLQFEKLENIAHAFKFILNMILN